MFTREHDTKAAVDNPYAPPLPWTDSPILFAAIGQYSVPASAFLLLKYAAKERAQRARERGLESRLVLIEREPGLTIRLIGAVRRYVAVHLQRKAPTSLPT